MSTPLVDVLVPARNAAGTIRGTICSIQRQTVTDLRIIAIDDGSADATGAILAELAAADPRIHVIRGPQQGVVGALNLGIEAGSAAFLARQDSDDLAYPDRLARQIDYLQANPDCVAVGCDVRHIDPSGRPVGTFSEYAAPDRADFLWLPAAEPYLPGPFLLARRAAVLAVGKFRPMHVAEDTDLCWRLQEVGRLHNLPAVLGDYRLHPDSISSRSIRHGRVMAVCSQLAAVSARRRRSGRRDLQFSRAAMTQQDAAASLADLNELASTDLEPDERRWFTLAIAAKLVELAMYRPFELDPADCRFIAAALRAHDDLLSPLNRAGVARALLRSAMRLAVAGRLRDAALIVPPQRLYTVAIAAVVRFGVPALQRRARLAVTRLGGRPRDAAAR